jgi:GrpB-like predicted nucleotidyltransferase (UPF0157 family)
MIEPYDPLWPDAFAAEAARIERACADEELPIRLEHIGSTAVPGMSAKPVIDILAGCPPRASRAAYVAALRQLGYEHKGAFGIPGRNYFRRGAPRSHHLHLVSWSSAFWRDHLLFRDYLRAHEDVAREYAALKRELAATFRDARDRTQYTDAKGPFIRSVLRLARGGDPVAAMEG